MRRLSRFIDTQWWSKCRYIKYYEKMKIDGNIILIESQHGKEMNGNVFYILRYLSSSEKYSRFKIYLSAQKDQIEKFNEFIKSNGMRNVKPVIVGSSKYYKIISSAKYLINDNTFLPFFIKKEGQVYLNTWHGTPLKSLGRRIRNDAHAIGNAQKNFIDADYLLFPNIHTRDAILKDYMVENIAKGSYVMGGYPRNEAFFDDERKEQIKKDLNLGKMKIYAYMPTFRGKASNVDSERYTHYLYYYLYEIDKQLKKDEILYVNLHPISKKDIDFEQFTHIFSFPAEYETYEFLNLADVLITDYSSVFFDYACSKRKIVLFPYDRDEYLSDRGLYMSMDSLPFPIVYDAENLVKELRLPKNYDDANFVNSFCFYEKKNASQELCDYVILNEDNEMKAVSIPNNNKENILIFAGNMAPNGITTSIRNLLNVVSLEERNYYLYFLQKQIWPYRNILDTLPDNLYYYAYTGIMNITFFERIFYNLFNRANMSTSLYIKLMGKRIHQDFDKTFKSAKFDRAIQFSGYDRNIILKFGEFDCPKYIFVHSDMLAEISVRHNSQRELLNYAYNKYDKVAAVTKGILEPTYTLAGKEDNIMVVNNVIDYKSVLEKSKSEITFDPNTVISVDENILLDVLKSSSKKFINIGRFGPEKGHNRLVDAFDKFLGESSTDAYLIIVGGSSYDNGYNKLLDYIREKGLEERVLLVMRVTNPYPILNACDYFVLSSFYEGFGLVLAEADILNKPVISTDIAGPRDFMMENGGTLVENSENGIYEGLKMLSAGIIKPMNIDYEAYNANVVKSFEQLLSD